MGRKKLSSKYTKRKINSIRNLKSKRRKASVNRIKKIKRNKYTKNKTNSKKIIYGGERLTYYDPYFIYKKLDSNKSKQIVDEDTGKMASIGLPILKSTKKWKFVLKSRTDKLVAIRLWLPADTMSQRRVAYEHAARLVKEDTEGEYYVECIGETQSVPLEDTLIRSGDGIPSSAEGKHPMIDRIEASGLARTNTIEYGYIAVNTPFKNRDYKPGSSMSRDSRVRGMEHTSYTEEMRGDYEFIDKYLFSEHPPEDQITYEKLSNMMIFDKGITPLLTEAKDGKLPAEFDYERWLQSNIKEISKQYSSKKNEKARRWKELSNYGEYLPVDYVATPALQLREEHPIINRDNIELELQIVKAFNERIRYELKSEMGVEADWLPDVFGDSGLIAKAASWYNRREKRNAQEAAAAAEKAERERLARQHANIRYIRMNPHKYRDHAGALANAEKALDPEVQAEMLRQKAREKALAVQYR